MKEWLTVAIFFSCISLLFDLVVGGFWVLFLEKENEFCVCKFLNFKSFLLCLFILGLCLLEVFK